MLVRAVGTLPKQESRPSTLHTHVFPRAKCETETGEQTRSGRDRGRKEPGMMSGLTAPTVLNFVEYGSHADKAMDVVWPLKLILVYTGIGWLLDEWLDTATHCCGGRRVAGNGERMLSYEPPTRTLWGSCTLALAGFSLN